MAKVREASIRGAAFPNDGNSSWPALDIRPPNTLISKRDRQKRLRLQLINIESLSVLLLLRARIINGPEPHLLIIERTPPGPPPPPPNFALFAPNPIYCTYVRLCGLWRLRAKGVGSFVRPGISSVRGRRSRPYSTPTFEGASGQRGNEAQKPKTPPSYADEMHRILLLLKKRRLETEIKERNRNISIF